MKTLLKISLCFFLLFPLMSHAQRPVLIKSGVTKKPTRGTKQKVGKSNKNNNESNKPVKHITGYYNLPDNLRPSFENTPVWRIQLKVRTATIKDSETDHAVSVQLHNGSSSIYYLETARDDREQGRTDSYDILDQNIKTIKDIQFMKFGIKGSDGWRCDRVELYINNAPHPIYRKYYSKGFLIDGNSSAPKTYTISGKTLRQGGYWMHYENNRVIWLPPTVIRHTVLENMVESYVGHMIESDPQMKSNNMGYGYRDGPKSVTATKKAGNKVHFTLDMQSHKVFDFEVDVSFDMLVFCKNNKLTFEAKSVKGKAQIPIISSVFDVFGLDVFNKCLGGFTLGNSNVPFCPTIRVNGAGDITLRP